MRESPVSQAVMNLVSTSTLYLYSTLNLNFNAKTIRVLKIAWRIPVVVPCTPSCKTHTYIILYKSYCNDNLGEQIVNKLWISVNKNLQKDYDEARLSKGKKEFGNCLERIRVQTILPRIQFEIVGVHP